MGENSNSVTHSFCGGKSSSSITSSLALRHIIGFRLSVSTNSPYPAYPVFIAALIIFCHQLCDVVKFISWPNGRALKNLNNPNASSMCDFSDDSGVPVTHQRFTAGILSIICDGADAPPPTICASSIITRHHVIFVNGGGM